MKEGVGMCVSEAGMRPTDSPKSTSIEIVCVTGTQLDNEGAVLSQEL